MVVLSRAGKRGAQGFQVGLVKPREIAHDSQLNRLYRAEVARIEADGGRVVG